MDDYIVLIMWFLSITCIGAVCVGLVIGGLFLLIFLFKRFSERKTKKEAKLSSSYNGQIMPNNPGKPIYESLIVDGIEFRTWTVTEKTESVDNNKPSENHFFIMAIIIGHDFNMTIWQGSIGSQLYSKYRKEAIPIKIGDPVLDEKYQVITDKPDQAQAFLQSAKRREALEKLNAKGFFLFTIGQDSVQIKKPHVSNRDLVVIDLVALNQKEYISQLCNLAL
jgi:hypothetical protein